MLPKLQVSVTFHGTKIYNVILTPTFHTLASIQPFVYQKYISLVVLQVVVVVVLRVVMIATVAAKL